MMTIALALNSQFGFVAMAQLKQEETSRSTMVFNSTMKAKKKKSSFPIFKSLKL